MPECGTGRPPSAATRIRGANNWLGTHAGVVKDPLAGVERTLLMPLWGRAKLTQEGNPLLEDPWAVEVVERLGYDFGDIDAVIPRVGHLVTALRARIIDDLIMVWLRQHPDGAVVDLGCGLDTAFWRVDNGRLRWYGIDLPEVIALRRELLPESTRSVCIAASLFDTAWFDQLKVNTDVLFTCAGVLEYFSPAEVIRLLVKLASGFPGAEIIFNVTSRNIVNAFFTHRSVKRMGMTASPNRLGDIVPKLQKMNHVLTVAECFPMISRFDLPVTFDGRTVKQLRIFDRVSRMKIVRVCLAAQSNDGLTHL